LVLGAALAVPAVVLVVAGELTGSRVLQWAGYVFLLGLYLTIIRLMLQRIVRAPAVTLDEIALALCTYVLLGMLWMLFYVPLAADDPTRHFAFATPPAADDVNFALTYFSYVTLTTLGYGDITPISPLARSLAILEALTGVLFLAVLISRLVGAYGVPRGRGDGGD
ncbi:MAG TPA: potassium channel family protein, partial [Candidatus Krumholzibacteria bacterium]|nr:potassium channel family protein [Candidatus Krumholzibacteria bacterium]